MRQHFTLNRHVSISKLCVGASCQTSSHRSSLGQEEWRPGSPGRRQEADWVLVQGPIGSFLLAQQALVPLVVASGQQIEQQVWGQGVTSSQCC